MQTAEKIDLFLQFSPMCLINTNDQATLMFLESSKNIDEWNRWIAQLENIQLRSLIEQSGVIHKIIN